MKRLLSLTLIISVLTLFCFLQAQEMIGPVADTYISNDDQAARFSPDSTHGTETALLGRYLPDTRCKVPYIRFDVSDYKESYNLENVQIGLYTSMYKGVNNCSLLVYILTDDALDNWDEETTCFVNAPGIIHLDPPPLARVNFDPAKSRRITFALVPRDCTEIHQPDPEHSGYVNGIDYFYTDTSAALDNFINNVDGNGLLTFMILEHKDQDGDISIFSREDPEGRLPILVFETKPKTSIDRGRELKAATYRLEQNYPNPFNPVTTIEFELKEKGYTTLKVYNMMGQLVSTLIEGELSAGEHMIKFDGRKLPTGLYFYELKSGNFSEMKKMVLLK
ncbi:MAG: T9SS type A sorting domain-containing protein [Candidatus Marinimicrobia bacterium]|nr:T9SS type A sorting domain-containing protein [Candidatus Neomarinimicrobiota bacterium]